MRLRLDIDIAVLEDAPTHVLERGNGNDAHHRLRLLTRAGLQAHLHDTEQPVRDVSYRIEVLNARVRHVPLIAKHQAAANHQFVRLEAVPERNVAHDRDDRGRNQQQHQPGLPVASSAIRADEDQDTRERNVLQLRAQAEEHRRRMQAIVRRHRRFGAARVDRESATHPRARDPAALPWRMRCPPCR